MSFLGFGAGADIKVEFRDQEALKQVTMKTHTDARKKSFTNRLYVFSGNETIAGKVFVSPTGGKKLVHDGIKIELIGQVELAYDRGNHYVFTSLIRELDAPGELGAEKAYPFEFANVEKQYETYNGINVRLRYFVRIKISRQYGASIKKEVDFAVQNLKSDPEINNTLKMEVGIEDCLHIEFEYDKSKYHLEDVIVGKIYFLLVRIKIKHMELQILKRESTGSGPNLYNETDVVTKFEIMDGAPVRGEIIPIRLFLSPFDLTPTFKNVHNKFSVKYYLNLVLVDEEDRRYFKQQEFNLRRKVIKFDPPKKGKSTSTS